MDAATAGVLTTGALGLAGIVATFFAPTWTQTKLARRQESRDFRKARRLVTAELVHCGAVMRIVLGAIDNPDEDEIPFAELHTVEWGAHRSVLASALPDEAWEPVRQA